MPRPVRCGERPCSEKPHQWRRKEAAPGSQFVSLRCQTSVVEPLAIKAATMRAKTAVSRTGYILATESRTYGNKPGNKRGNRTPQNGRVRGPFSTKNLRSNHHPKLGTNVGTEPPKNGPKRGIRADQKAKRVNNLAFFSPAGKTSTPGSNPGGASISLANSSGCSQR